MSTQRNARADRLGWRIQHQIAELITLALDHIDTELRFMSVTGSGSGGDQLGVSGGGRTVHVDEDEHGPAERIPVTAVEAAIIRAHEMRDAREEIRDRLDGIIIATEALDKLLRHTIGTRLPRTIVELCDGQAKGYAGHMLVWRRYDQADDNGWHDPSCRDAAGPTGLCDACLIRANRWRARNGHPRIASDARSEVVGSQTHVA